MDGSNNSQSNIIRKLKDDTVKKISTGQVIFDLASAVKELVDNSLDAAANHIGK